MTDVDEGSVYAKTALGVDELANQSRGLNPRMRQLLILIDGHRGETQLARLISREALESYLPSLEAAGFIARVRAAPEHPTRVAPAASTSAHPPPANEKESLTTPLVDVGSTDWPGRDSDADTQAHSALDDGHEDLSQRLVTALLEVAGAHGGELANRIKGCQSRREVREFLPAALSIVEMVAGQDGIRCFQERAGLR